MTIRLWKFYFGIFKYKLVFLLLIMILGTMFEGLGLAIIISMLDQSEKNVFNGILSNFGVYLPIYTFVFLVFFFRGIVVWYANRTTASLFLSLKQKTLEKSLLLSVSSKFKVLEALGDSSLINLVIKEIPNIALGFKVFMHMLRSILVSIAYIAIPVYLAPSLSSIIFVFILLGLAVFFLLQNYLKQISFLLVLANEKLLWRLKSIFNALANIKAGNRNQKVLTDINIRIKNILRLETKQAVVIEPALESSLETIVFMLLIGTVVYNDSAQILEDSVLILCIGMLFKALSSINGIYSNFRKIYSYSGSFMKLENIHNTLIQNTESFLNKSSLNETLLNINLKDASIVLDNHELVNGFSLYCEVGQSIAIVGKSGSGKTSVLNALATLTEFDNGEYLANDGIKISKNKMFIRNNASYLTQQYYFEEEFVKNCFENKFLEDSDVHNSLLLLGLIEPGTNFKKFGEVKISQLSGGERQRLAIATEFLKRKTLYLLDEITSALNVEHEDLVADFIKQYSGNKIVIVVTHSENFAANFVQIINLDFNH